MKTQGTDSEKLRHIAVVCLRVFCVAAVMAAAVLVRSAPASFKGDSEAIVEAYTDESGIPYLTDMDSYYHVRLVDTYLESSSIADTYLEDGSAWDTHSYYPEGRSAEYQPGIVWLTAAVWKLFGGSLAVVEYRIAAFVSALAALVAYVIGRRFSGWAGGLAAGLLVGCAPQFALRTCYGRFDTDMFVVLMELLLILFFMESMRAKTGLKKAVFAAAFAASASVYALCWTPRYTFMFAGLTLAGGLVYILAAHFSPENKASRTAGAFFKSPAFLALLAGGLLSVFGLMLIAGPSIIKGIISVFSFSTTSSTGQGVLPNLFASVSELAGARFFPVNISQMFSGYVAGEAPAVVNGVGGAAALLLSFIGLIWLLISCIPGLKTKLWAPDRPVRLLYLCVLGVWMAGGLFLMRYGVRFMEHMAIPVGLLAGGFIGQLFMHAKEKRENGAAQSDRKTQILRIAVPVLVCAAAVIPAVAGSARACSGVRPSVTDSSVNAMLYIENNAKSDDAVIASWWDMGYFYESESDHPCLWDGGTQIPARAILVAKALVTEDMELSRRIILMLSGSGNAAVEYLMDRTDPKTVYEALWEALPLEKTAARKSLAARCSISAKEAEEAEALIHPAVSKETYFIITYTMTRQIGWYEYYANWDFTGEQPLPSATLYDYTPDGTPLFNTEAGQAYLSSIRGKETMWELFFNAKKTPCFTPAFEWHDGLEHVRVWKVEP